MDNIRLNQNPNVNFCAHKPEDSRWARCARNTRFEIQLERHCKSSLGTIKLLGDGLLSYVCMLNRRSVDPKRKPDRPIELRDSI